MWRTSNEANNPDFFRPTFTNSVSVMVWGCVGPNGIGKLAVCQRKVDECKILYRSLGGESFAKCINNLWGCWNAFYISRGQCSLPYCKFYQSPDLNIIENVWLYMKNAMNRDPPKTKDELMQKNLEIWSHIPRDFISKLYVSIPRRLMAVLQSRGYPTKY